MKQLNWVWLVWLIWFNSFDLPQLTTFTTGDYSFWLTTELILTGLIDLIQFIWSSSINHIHYRREFIPWNNWIDFDWFDWFDSIHLIFLNYLHLWQEMNHSMKQLRWIWLVWLIWFNSFDLPQFTTFETGNSSFHNTSSLNLTSLIGCLQLIWSSEINYIYYRILFILWNNWIEFD